MTGRKGKSGVPRTPKQRADKVKAGRASWKARDAANKIREDQERRQREADAAANPDPLATLPKGRPATLDDYDRILGRPISWTDAKKREEVEAEILANKARVDEAAIRRQNLFTREQVDKRDRAFDQLVITHLESVVDLLDLVPADRRPAAQDRAKFWVASMRTKISEAVRDQRAG